MAGDPLPLLSFDGVCPDCGQRRVATPEALPDVGDDFDWDLRDYDGFRLFMLQGLAARFPERHRWTPADVEVALVEVLAFALDQISDGVDRAAAESYLESARRPESLRRLLKLVGYEAAGLAKRLRDAPFATISAAQAREPLSADDVVRFDNWWLDHPEKMDLARRNGPRAVHDQHRMVTLEDFARRLEEHPLVLRAHPWESWDGAWTTVHVALIAWHSVDLDGAGVFDDTLWDALGAFHAERAIYLPPRAEQPSVRAVLHPYLEAYRLVGQEVVVEAAVEVGVHIVLSIEVDRDYFQSEVAQAVDRALGSEPGGFFEPGRLRFGEDLWASDIYQVVMALDGVENVCINRFKRLGDRFADQSASGRIALEGLEVAICDNDAQRPQRGYRRVALHGGRRG